MSKQDVYRQLSINDGVRNQIAGFNRVHLARIYASALRDARVQVGYTDKRVDITGDKRAEQRVREYSDKVADRIQRVTNERLAKKLAALPSNATDAELHSGLAEWKQAVLEHNAETLIPHIEAQSVVMAHADFHERNGIVAYGTLQPNSSHSPPDDICVQTLDAGEQPMQDLYNASEWPAHNHCDHMPVVSRYEKVPPEGASWP